MRYLKALAVSLCCGFLFLAVATSAKATTYTVTKTADTNDGTCNADCSLREAVAAANGNSGNDTIEFAIPEADGGYVAPSGSTQGYFSLSITGVGLDLTDDSGVFINGYSQTGASRNTATFGETLDTVLKIQVKTASLITLLRISGNNNHVTGLNLVGSTATPDGSRHAISIDTSSSNWIEGNFIGSDISGTTSFGTGLNAIINDSASNIIGTNGDGTDDKGERNLVMGASSQYKWTAQTGATNNNVIAGNYLGVDKTSRTCSASLQGRSMVAIFNGSGNRVGSNFDGVSDSEEANIAACVTTNARGVIQFGGAATGTLIQGNYIGTNTYNDALSTFLIAGFRDNGVASNYTIKRNVIAHNADGGIWLINNSSSGVTISQNSIYDNGALGIDLVPTGQTANDVGDTDTGANNLMNYPVLQSACRPNSTDMYFVADLDFQSSEGPFTIEFFANDELDATGYGEGKTYLGSTTTGNVGSSMPLTIALQTTAPDSPENITATATNASGSTSEFSAALGDASYDTGCVSSPTVLPETFSQPAPTSCTDFAPVGTPDLFQILRIKNSVVVFFTPVLNSTRSYLVMYGFKEGEERYGASLESLTAESNLGVQKLAISDLEAKQEYWFKVAPKNGCAVGEWSNWMKAGKWQGSPKLFYRSP
jgi:CSLREA domain-containing protein